MSNNKFDLLKLHRNYFQAAVENVKQANVSIRDAQNWMLALGLAEMSFIGAVFLQNKNQYLTLIPLHYVLLSLLVSFISFLLGAIAQFTSILKGARYYERLASDILSYVHKNGGIVNKVPSEFEVKKDHIMTSKYANLFMYFSLMLIFFSTLAVIVIIFDYVENGGYVINGTQILQYYFVNRLG